MPVWTPPSYHIISSIYYSTITSTSTITTTSIAHGSIQHRLHELLHHHYHPLNMLDGRSLEIKKADLLSIYSSIHKSSIFSSIHLVSNYLYATNHKFLIAQAMMKCDSCLAVIIDEFRLLYYRSRYLLIVSSSSSSLLSLLFILSPFSCVLGSQY